MPPSPCWLKWHLWKQRQRWFDSSRGLSEGDGRGAEVRVLHRKIFPQTLRKDSVLSFVQTSSVLTENYHPKLASPYRQIYGTPYQKDTKKSYQNQTCTSGQVKMTRNVRSNRCVFSSQLNVYWLFKIWSILKFPKWFLIHELSIRQIQRDGMS